MERVCKICGKPIKRKYAKLYCTHKCCLIAKKQNDKKDREDNPEKYREKHKRNREKRIDHYRAECRKSVRKWRSNNIEKVRAYKKSYYGREKVLGKKRRDGLSDAYIRGVIISVANWNDIPIKLCEISKSMIEIKRQQIKLFRLLKKAKEALNGASSG